MNDISGLEYNQDVCKLLGQHRASAAYGLIILLSKLGLSMYAPVTGVHKFMHRMAMKKALSGSVEPNI